MSWSESITPKQLYPLQASSVDASTELEIRFGVTQTPDCGEQVSYALTQTNPTSANLPSWIILLAEDRRMIVDTVDIANSGTYEFRLTATATPSNTQTSTIFEIRLGTLDDGLVESMTPYFESTEGFSPQSMSCGDSFAYTLPTIVNPSPNSKLKIMYFPNDTGAFLDFDASTK